MSLLDIFRISTGSKSSEPQCLVPSTQGLQSAVQIYSYFIHNFLSPFNLQTLPEAIDASLNYFSEYYHAEGRELFARIVKASANDCHAIQDDLASVENISELHQRVQEYFTIEAMSVESGRRRRFDEVDVQLAIASMYQNGERVKKSPEKAAAWLQRAAARSFGHENGFPRRK